jgi:hypothetical protein
VSFQNFAARFLLLPNHFSFAAARRKTLQTTKIHILKDQHIN